MPNVTLAFCRDLLSLRDQDLQPAGLRLVARMWSSRAVGVHHVVPAPVRGLASSAGAGRLGSVEKVAFLNTLSFVNAQDPGRRNADPRALAAMIFSATALADARGLSCGELSRAIGVGLEAHLRLLASIEGPDQASDFDWKVMAGTFAAIVACGAIEDLTADGLNTAIGLGGSVITAAAGGYQPVQMAMAAQDAITMVRLAASGFLSPPDVLMCRWGIFDAFQGNRKRNPDALLRPSTGLEAFLRALPGNDDAAQPSTQTPVRDFVSRADEYPAQTAA